MQWSKIMQKSMQVVVLLGAAFHLNAQTLAEELAARLDKMGTFDAAFEQRVFNPKGEALKGSQGTIHVGKNRRFVVDIQSPDAVKIISDGTTLWTYDVGLEQVSKQNVKSALKGSVAQFILYTTPQSLKSFNIQKFAKDDSGVQAYELTPKRMTDDANVVRIYFLGPNLVGAHFEDMIPNSIEISFLDLVKPSRLPAKEFHFVPPPHVDVIEDNL